MNKVNFISPIPKVLQIEQVRVTRIIEESLTTFGVDRKIVEIWFVSDKIIKKYNLKYRQIDNPTDVLSFPQTQIETKGFQVLGSIMISAKTVIKKGERIDDVLKHGLLHLLNFDHEKDSDEKLWEEAARKINCEL